MNNHSAYDCAIIGGGVSGLCLAIQLAGSGLNVVLFEKNNYPINKVCGEYISMESHHFLSELGLPLHNWQLPSINELGISSETGFMLNTPLKLGGFGISRYTLDNELYILAIKNGVTVHQNCKIQNITPTTNGNTIEVGGKTYFAELICGSYGKYTPVFVQEQPDYKQKPMSKINYIGVKYHIKTKLSDNRIELHNFKNGYCGVSKVDRDLYCLCYLSDSRNLLENGNQINTMEENVLHKNPFLKSYFTESEFVTADPLVISNIQFSKKQTHTNSLLLLGDAAGSISPLCGNGMSIGMRASKLLATEIQIYFNGHRSKMELNKNYDTAWNKAFNTRIKAGSYIQRFFGKRIATHIALKLLNYTPLLTQKVISLTHGQPF